MKKMEAQVGKVETQLRQWGAKLDELKTAGSEKRETFKAGAKNAWNKLGGAFKKVTNQGEEPR